MTDGTQTSETPEWGTERSMIDVARATLGRIDFDPFTSRRFNEIVGAERILTARDDAFRCTWFPGVAPSAGEILTSPASWMTWASDRNVTLNATALVNPPGDKSGANVQRAWLLTWWHWRFGYLADGVVWVMFNVNQLQTLQRCWPAPSPIEAEFALLVPKRRVRYRTEKRSALTPDAPPHASALVLLPSHDKATRAAQLEIFRSVGARLGAVRT